MIIEREYSPMMAIIMLICLCVFMQYNRVVFDEIYNRNIWNLYEHTMAPLEECSHGDNM